MTVKIKMTLKKRFSVGEPCSAHDWGYNIHLELRINQPQMSVWEYGVSWYEDGSTDGDEFWIIYVEGEVEFN